MIDIVWNDTWNTLDKLNEDISGVDMKPKAPYMLRDDGAIFSVSTECHPYIWYTDDMDASENLMLLFEPGCGFLRWFWDHCDGDYSYIRDEIRELVQAGLHFCKQADKAEAANMTDYNSIFQSSDLVTHYIYRTAKDLEITSDMTDIETEEEFLEYIRQLHEDCNNIFCRIRIGGLYTAVPRSVKVIYFRIGSNTGFNWFDLIWEVAYKYKHLVDYITVCTDEQSGRDGKYYKIGSAVLNEYPIDDFIMLKGNLVIEQLEESMYVNPKTELKAVQTVTATLSDEEFDRIGDAYWIDSPYIIYRKVAYSDEKKPVGFLDVYQFPDRLQLDWLRDYPDTGVVVLAVAPDARGSGLGYRLGKEMVDFFTSADTDLRRLYWSVDTTNEAGAASKSIAEKLGFKRVSRNGTLDEYILDLKGDTDEFTTTVSATEYGDKVDFFDTTGYVGTANTATVERDNDFIYNVIVDPDKRGKGYGTRIMRWMMSHYPIELLNVAKDNKIAKGLYKKLGFRKECNVRLDDDTVGDRMRLVNRR